MICNRRALGIGLFALGLGVLLSLLLGSCLWLVIFGLGCMGFGGFLLCRG